MPVDLQGAEPMMAMPVQGPDWAVATAAVPSWERRLVAVAFLLHVLDVSLDLVVMFMFLFYLHIGFFLVTLGIILAEWFLSSMYISYSGNMTVESLSKLDGGGFLTGTAGKRGGRWSFGQAKLFREAYRCVFDIGDTDTFYTMRLMEAILEAAPNGLAQLYALALYSGVGTEASPLTLVLSVSVISSAISVGLGLALWERKLQPRTTAQYVISVSLFRVCEVLSRSLTLALFAVYTQGAGVWWALLLDYGTMILLVWSQRSVQVAYSFVVAVPLVLMSIEPFVWRWEDHAVPKGSYFVVRVVEFALMWLLILSRQETVDIADPDDVAHVIWKWCKTLAIASTVGLYCALPLVWSVARKHAMPQSAHTEVEDDDEEDGTMEGPLHPIEDGAGYCNEDSDGAEHIEAFEAGHL